MKILIQFISLWAFFVFSSSIYAQSFPGGEPLTQQDLTQAATGLPNAPPQYDPNNPIDHKQFARFAWRQFIYLNSPAKPSADIAPGKTTVVRGIIDPNRSFKQSGQKDFYQKGQSTKSNFSQNILVWESYAHRSELFPYHLLPSGHFQIRPPQYLFSNVGVSANHARFNNLDENSQIGQNKIFFPKNGRTPAENPYDDDEILFEAKVNEVEYNYVKTVSGTKAPSQFTLPDETVEIKAAWRALSPELIKSGRYHTAEALYYYKQPNGQVASRIKTFGLVGLHIIRKMAHYEAFVYSTFEHVDNLNSGLYFFTLYNCLTYTVERNAKGEVKCPNGEQRPTAILNTGPSKVTTLLPKEGAVIAANGYDFIHGEFTLPTGPFAGPIKVVQPSTLTQAVQQVNKEVKQLMQQSGLSSSVWQYYQLKGVQPLPTNEDSSITDNNPLTQDYFLANNVIESSQPGIQLFKGGAPGPVPGQKANQQVLPNPRDSANIQHVPGLPDSANKIVMGGCMGCHGQAKYLSNGLETSIFSFLISADNLSGQGGFEADELNESVPDMMIKSSNYLATDRK